MGWNLTALGRERDTGQRRATRIGTSLTVCWYVGAAMLWAWPMLLGRSNSVVPGLQNKLWPWIGTTNPDIQVAAQRDGAVSSYPWSVTYHEALRRFEFPWWDWHSFSTGYDLASDGVSGALYPVHWVLWFLFDPPVAHDFYMLLHLVLGGLAMHCLLRHWQLGAGPALIGGTAWMFASYQTAWLQAEMLTPILVFTPLLFLTFDSAVVTGKWRWIGAASLTAALAMVAGNIVVFVTLAWVVGLVAAARVVFMALSARSVRVLIVGIGRLVAIGIGTVVASAWALLPTLLNLTSVPRIPFKLEEIVPTAEIWPSVQLLWTSPAPIDSTGKLFMLTWSGTAAIALAAIGLLAFRRLVVLAIALVSFFLLLSASTHLVTAGWYLIPPLRAISGYGRLYFFIAFGIAVLAALGAQVIVGVTSNLAGTLLRDHSSSAMPKWLSQASTGAVGVVGSCLVLAQMVPFAQAANPAWVDRDRASFYPSSPAIEAMKTEGDWPGLMLPMFAPAAEPPASPDMAWVGIPFWGSTAHTQALDSVGGYDSAVGQRSAAITRVMQGASVADAVTPFSTAFLPDFNGQWARIDYARRLGVTHLYGPPSLEQEDSIYYDFAPQDYKKVYEGPDGSVWEVREPLRGPRVVGRAVVVKGPVAALNELANQKSARPGSVILEQGFQATGVSVGQTSVSGSESVGLVTSSARGADSAEVHVRMSEPGWLVMPITFNRGWRVSSEGQDLVIQPADFNSSAVKLQPGEHFITFTYRPPGLRLGLLVTFGGLLAFLMLILARRRWGGGAPFTPLSERPAS